METFITLGSVFVGVGIGVMAVVGIVGVVLMVKLFKHLKGE